MIYYPAPAKINRFLRVVRQESDGYHSLQTIFQFTDLYDLIGFKRIEGQDRILFHYDHIDFSLEDDLIYRAIQCLQSYNRQKYGVEIELKKRLPIGGGLGGGSSNAATTLIALNYIWELNLSTETLIKIGSELGADVPIFIYGSAAWAEGRGDQFTPAFPTEETMLLINPHISISTQTIFSSPTLSRNNPLLSINNDQSVTLNDCLSAIYHHYPLMKEYMTQLEELELHPQVTGTGSSIFIRQHYITPANQKALETLALKNEWAMTPFNTLNQNIIYQQIKKQEFSYPHLNG